MALGPAMRDYLWGVLRTNLTEIRIIFVARDLKRWWRILSNIEPRAGAFIKNEMQRECANDYVNLLHENITSQKYAAIWASKPYHVDYRDWKNAYFGQRGFWRLKDDVLNNLTYWKAGDGWMGGIPGGIMDTGGKSWFYPADSPKQYPPREIAMYARMNEFGWQAQRKSKAETERPLFRPTKKEYGSSSQRLARGRTALRRTVAQWRM